MGFWDFFWLLVWSFFFVMYLMVLFHIISDLFRDNSLNGWLKALWIIALLVVPFLSALIYLIARGEAWPSAKRTRAATDQYIQTVAGHSNSAGEIETAKALLDAGTITRAEFETLKQKALA